MVMSAKEKETRTRVRYRFDPARDAREDLPDKFVLKADTEHQVRDGRVSGGWATEHTDYGVVLTPVPLTRQQLADLVGDGASALAYLGEPQDRS
jgi:hypothetical protein